MTTPMKCLNLRFFASTVDASGFNPYADKRSETAAPTMHELDGRNQILIQIWPDKRPNAFEFAGKPSTSLSYWLRSFLYSDSLLVMWELWTLEIWFTALYYIVSLIELEQSRDDPYSALMRSSRLWNLEIMSVRRVPTSVRRVPTSVRRVPILVWRFSNSWFVCCCCACICSFSALIDSTRARPLSMLEMFGTREISWAISGKAFCDSPKIRFSSHL